MSHHPAVGRTDRLNMLGRWLTGRGIGSSHYCCGASATRFLRMGEYADTHLRWSRGSALTSLTASRTDASYAVVEAQRRARQAVAGLADTPLHEAALIAQAEAKRLGSCAFSDPRPGLDPNLTASTAALVLHEGKVPLTQYGLWVSASDGPRNQENATSERSIVALDEIQHGLEPHRLLHLTSISA